MNKLIWFHEGIGTPDWVRGQQSTVISVSKTAATVHVIWVAWQKPDGAIAYDQILRAERPGGAFLPINPDGHVGLQKQFRPQAVDQVRYTQGFPQIDLSNLGRPSWEIPRGFAKDKPEEAGTGEVEAEEETGHVVISRDWLTFACDNTAFSPHMTDVHYGNIDLNRTSRREKDPHEQILEKLTYFSAAKLNELRENGELYCAITLAAIGALMLKVPGLIK